MTGPAPAAGLAVTVWFDGDCPLCRQEVAFIRRLDRRGAIDFVDLTLGGTCPTDREALLKRFHAREAGAVDLVSGAEAFAAMWRAIPLLRPFGQLARIPPVLWLLERAYRGFLHVRPTLQALVRGLSRSSR